MAGLEAYPTQRHRIRCFERGGCDSLHGRTRGTAARQGGRNRREVQQRFASHTAASNSKSNCAKKSNRCRGGSKTSPSPETNSSVTAMKMNTSPPATAPGGRLLRLTPSKIATNDANPRKEKRSRGPR